jgi:imidazolonepropionase-like amidohydrolase
MNRLILLIVILLSSFHLLWGQTDQTTYLLHPDHVFDGQNMHENWAVLVEGNRIKAAGPEKDIQAPANAEVLTLPGCTLLPGMIEGHAHLLLHPYDETPWNDQVLKESEAERVIRATVHAKKTLLAGFTTLRDLGSEGAGYADVGIKTSIEKGIIPGPRMLVSGRALVTTGSYGPKGFAPHVSVPLGAEPSDGDDLIRATRNQIGKGADFIKVYADYRWGPEGEAQPTFLLEELKTIVAVANSSGRPVVAHASTPEGMRRAILAGVETIEHGDGGTREIFELMKEKGVALCPTIAAGDAITQYRGWKKGQEPDPPRIQQKKKSVRLALETGVTICAGGDVGVFSHGDNVRELEMMVDYGMSDLNALRAVTSVNAQLFHLQEKLGTIQPGKLADLVAVQGRPDKEISDLRKVRLVMKDGKVYLMQK